MEISRMGCVGIIVVGVIILMVIGVMQEMTDGYFLSIVVFAVIAFFVGKEMGKDSSSRNR